MNLRIGLCAVCCWVGCAAPSAPLQDHAQEPPLTTTASAAEDCQKTCEAQHRAAAMSWDAIQAQCASSCSQDLQAPSKN